jgi:hypothetical protein
VLRQDARVATIGELAADAETSGKSRFPSSRVLINIAHHVVCRQMGKGTTTIHTPHLPPLPVLRLPALTSYTRSFVPVRARIAILQQKSSPIHEKESRLPNGFLAAPTTKSRGSRGSNVRQSASRATSAASVRLPIGSYPQIARIRPASQSHSLHSIPPPFIWLFPSQERSDPPPLVNAKHVE